MCTCLSICTVPLQVFLSSLSNVDSSFSKWYTQRGLVTAINGKVQSDVNFFDVMCNVLKFRSALEE